MASVTLRPALPGDAPAVADIWRRGWRDGHLGNVPDEPIPVPAHRYTRQLI